MRRKPKRSPEFCKDQGVGAYEQINRGWIDILMKLASWRDGRPDGQGRHRPRRGRCFSWSPPTWTAFRQFVFESRFLHDLRHSGRSPRAVRTSDEALLCLGFDWMKNVLFNEPTMEMRDEVLQGAIAKARTEIGAA